MLDRNIRSDKRQIPFIEASVALRMVQNLDWGLYWKPLRGATGIPWGLEQTFASK